MAVVMGALGVLVLPGGLAFGINTLLNTTSGNAVDTAALTRVPATPAALLVGIDDTDSVTMLAMFALLPGGKGGTIVSIPAGAKAKTTKNGLIHRVADTYKTAGFDAFVNDVGGLLNVSFAASALMTAEQLGEMLAPVGQKQVNIASPVIETTAAGAPRQVLSAGTQTVDAARIATALLAAEPGARESTRWALQKSMWQLVASSAGGADAGSTTSSSAVVSPTTGVDSDPTSSTLESSSAGETPSDVAGFFGALMSGRVQYWQLSGTLVTEAQNNPLRTDMYDLDGGEVLVVVATVAPSAVTPANASLSFLIDTPYADARIVRQAAMRIAYIGGNVVIVRHVGGTPGAKTVVKYDDDGVRDEMSAFTTLFGPLQFVQISDRVEGVDAQIVLGDDFKAFIGSEEGSVIATTTTIAG